MILCVQPLCSYSEIERLCGAERSASSQADKQDLDQLKDDLASALDKMNTLDPACLRCAPQLGRV